jgi:hypothetical protein
LGFDVDCSTYDEERSLLALCATTVDEFKLNVDQLNAANVIEHILELTRAADKLASVRAHLCACSRHVRELTSYGCDVPSCESLGIKTTM